MEYIVVAIVFFVCAMMLISLSRKLFKGMSIGRSSALVIIVTVGVSLCFVGEGILDELPSIRDPYSVILIILSTCFFEVAPPCLILTLFIQRTSSTDDKNDALSSEDDRDKPLSDASDSERMIPE